MNKEYYEYANNNYNYENYFLKEDEDENLYPKALRQNMMPDNFSDMLNIQNYINNMKSNNMQNVSNTINNNCDLYDSYEGFLKGNMFPKLYSPYKGYKPREIKTSNSKEAMMLQIQELCFALIDMNLYLDIHPNDECIINKFVNTSREKEKLVKEYEKKYGPISITGEGFDKVPWAWNSVKSPWERSY